MSKKSSQIVMNSMRKNSDIIQFTVPKGERERIKAYAAAHGMSMNEFIRAAIRYQMENDVSFSLSKE